MRNNKHLSIADLLTLFDSALSGDRPAHCPAEVRIDDAGRTQSCTLPTASWPYLITPYTYPSYQLEQTGSTIFQTLAGLALDIKSKKAESVSPIDGDDGDVQLLLNAFVILNVFEILGIIGLSHLHKKQQSVAARRMSALLPTTVDGDESDEEPSEEHRVGKGPATDDENWQAESPAGTRHRRSSTLSRHVPLPSSSTPEQSIPLLYGGSRSSTMRGSRYLVDAVIEEEPSDPPVQVQVLRTKTEVRRGELFSVMCGVLIAFTWVLFMVTAWLKLRSKEERGGGGSGNVINIASHL